MKILFTVWISVISILPTCFLKAQDSTSTPRQIWPELEFYYRFNERFRLNAEVNGTKANSEYTDGTIAVNIDYFTLPWFNKRRDNTMMSDSSGGYYFWFRVGYSYSNTPPGTEKKEINIFETETNNTFNLPEQIVLQTRNRLDWRFVNGDFQPIYRPRVKFIRNLHTEYLTFNLFLWSEYFFYLNDLKQNRLRLTIGTEIKVLKWLEFEAYYLHQFANKYSVTNLNAIGLQFNMYFHSRKNE